MKNKALLVAMSKLLNIDESVLSAELEKENGDDSVLKGYTDKYKAYTATELATLIKNSNEAFLEKADFEANKVPSAIYSKVKGAVLEKQEKAIASKFGIAEYSGIDDLIDKIAKTNNDDKNSKGNEDLLRQIETLKLTVQEKDKALIDEVNKYVQKEIDFEKSNALKALSNELDYENDVLTKQVELLDSAFASKFKIQKKGEKVIVLDSSGNMQVDNLAEPLGVSSVLKSFAKGYGFKFKEPDNGGRGTGSSSSSQKVSLKGKTFAEALSESKAKPNTNEADEVFKQWEADNKN